MSLFQSILNILRFNRRNWKAVVLCIFAATIFWFFNALNKTYTTNLNFPVTFEYDSRNFIPVGNLPEYVRLNVTGNGWSLFKRSTGIKVSPLEVPIDRPAETKKIVGTSLPMFFSNQMDGLQINLVLTDTLYVDIEPRAGRWIKLTMDSLQNNLKKGYGIASEISIIPDSVFIEGPMRLINKFKEPVPLQLRQRHIDEDFTEDVEINISSSDVIKRDPATVTVAFKVEKLVMVKDSLTIEIENMPPTVSMVESRKIPVTFEVPESLAGEINLDSARAVLDLTNFRRGTTKLFPRIEGLPPFARAVKVDSIVIKL